MIAHSAVNIVDPDDDMDKYKKYEDSNIITMSHYDLEVEVQRLLQSIREIIMQFYLAVK